MHHYAARMENPLADIDRIEAISDPAERAIEIGRVLNALPDVQAKLRTMRQAAVQEMRAGGLDYTEIGDRLGVARARAWQIGEGK